MTFLAATGIYFASGIVVNGYQIGEYWFFLVVFSFLIAHGGAGLIIFRKGQGLF